MISVCTCLGLAVALGPVFTKNRDRGWGSVEKSGDFGLAPCQPEGRGVGDMELTQTRLSL